MKETPMTSLFEFQVVGEQQIHCAGCESRISYALRRVPGVRDVQASADTQQIAVVVDPAQVTLEAIQEKLQTLGYQFTTQRDA